ncbi:MAG: tRNA (adenosine(37)-N6)-dimethylallyltransferase MiaA [Proteobacteria bacterium]|nr:tRNA (adenosine(37)-N6)-dimethylallyltransferase MiaA [Pseudomonadota bacterium]
MIRPKKLLAIAGPTASGKTKISIDLALKNNAEIISSDSLLVYKHLDIGTAKPTNEERKTIKHHLIDIVEPWDNYTISDFHKDALSAIDNISVRNKQFIVTGGAGFYLNALINSTFEAPKSDPEIRKTLENRLKEGTPLGTLHNELKSIDPETAKRVHPNDEYRILRALGVYLSTGKTMTSFRQQHQDSKNKETVFEPLIIVLNPEKEELKTNIEVRTKKMFKDGLVEETKNLLKIGCTPDMKPLKSIGYKQAMELISRKISKEEAFASVIKDTAALAKRQITWFKKQPFTIWLHPIRDIEEIRRLAC